MISKEILEKRRADLIQGLEQKRAELNAFVGAIQDCDYWLSQIDREGDLDGSTATDKN